MPDRSFLLVFDFDGTLADTREDLIISANVIRERFALPPLSAAEVIDRVGNGAQRLVAAVLDLPIDHPRTAEALRLFKDHYGTHQVDHVRLYPGVRETLETLYASCFLAVISNKPGEMVRKLASHLGIDRWLHPLWGGEDVGAFKPDPTGLLAVMRLHGVAPGRTLMVGDMAIDIETGRRAGTATAFCTYGFRSISDVTLPPDHVIDRFSDLLALVEDLRRS